MTDKELRKLSRLELLEMLLEVSKENEKLKKKLKEAEIEERAAKSAESLSVTAAQMTTALEHINRLTDVLSENAQNVTAPKQNYSATPKEKQPSVSDVRLYCRILAFFAGNGYALEIMPEDIRSDVRNRINGILKNKKSN